MRKNKKVVSLLLCAALLVCSSVTGVDVEKTRAASVVSHQSTGLKAATGDAVQDGETESPAETTTPDTDASQAPAGTTTPNAVQTTIPPLVTNSVTPPAVSGSSVYAVGDKITVANYEYAIVSLPDGKTNGTVKLKGLVEKAKTKTSLVVPATVSKEGNTFSVVGIGPKAFTKSTALKKVVIRKNVQYISIRAFQCVKTLESVTIGEDVTTIKERAFAGCTGLRTVTIPSNVKLIGVRAFYKCTKLKSVVIESKKITTVKKYAFKQNKSGRYFVMPTGKKSLYQSLIKSSDATVKIYTY